MMKSSICTYLDENIIQQDFFFLIVSKPQKYLHCLLYTAQAKENLIDL